MFFFLSTKMLPAVAGLLPIYLFAQSVGLLDNIWLLIILYTSMNLPIAVWMMRVVPGRGAGRDARGGVDRRRQPDPDAAVGHRARSSRPASPRPR